MDYIPEMLEAYNNKLKSQLYGLLCEYERGRDWESFLDAIFDGINPPITVKIILITTKVTPCIGFSFATFFHSKK